MLFIVGLGLADEKDITVKGLETVRKCQSVYLEAYTSILGVDKDKLEALYGRPVQLAHREVVESGIDGVLEESLRADVAFLVVGDPFGATTHTDLVLRARAKGVPTHIIHNASIMNAIGACGLQLYRFGETVSIPFFADNWRPDSFYHKILRNTQAGLHTLCLLDIKVREPSLEAMVRGKTVYEAPRYMTVNTAIQQLLEIEEKQHRQAYGASTPAVGVARIGAESQVMVYGSLTDLVTVDFGPPLHSLVIAGELQDIEKEFASMYAVTGSTPRIKPEPEAAED